MKRFIQIVLFCSLSSLLSAQSNFRINVGKPIAAQAQLQEPGDSVSVDPTTQAIVANSRGRTVRLPVSHRVFPLWNCDLSKSGSDYKYLCVLSNQNGAAQRIIGFAIESATPERVKIATVGSWKHTGIAMVNQPFTLHFVNVVRDDSSTDVMSAGRTSGLFTLTSDLLLGLIQIEIGASELPTNLGEKSIGEQLDEVSPWVNLKLLELDTRERHMAYIPAIGPKVSPESDSLQRIKNEFAKAAGMKEFGPWRQRLSDLAKKSTSADLSSQLRVLPNVAGLPSLFRQAMLWRFERLPQ